VADEDERYELLHDLDSAAAPGGLGGRGTPDAVIHDLDVQGAGFGPVGDVDGVVGGGGMVGVVD
jgi:hypothetical protein